MDVAQLQAFVSVAQLRSFSQAAQQLHLTQPAVSKRISALESSCHCKLFERIGHQIMLTEAGQRLLPEAQSILLKISQTQEQLQTIGDNISGKLQMATSHHIGLHRMPEYLRRYHELYPNVQLDLQFIESETAYDSIKSGSIELAVITLPLSRDPKIEVQTLWQDKLCVVVNADHPLSHSLKPVQLKDLAEYPMLLPAEHTYTREIIQQPFMSQNLNLTIAMETHDLESLRMLVESGLGWSVLPEIMLRKSLRSLSCPELALERRLGIIKHKDRQLSGSASAMMELLTEGH